MRLWPKSWFHIHDWKKVLDMVPVRYSDLSGTAATRIGVVCIVGWCHSTKLIEPRGAYSHSYYPSEEVTPFEALGKTEKLAEAWLKGEYE